MRLFALAALVCLSACATMVQPKSQAMQITSVNGEDPKCILETPLNKYVAYPPQSIKVERSKYVLVIDCTANNGKHRRLLVPPEQNPTSVYGGPLVIVDKITGSAWGYPPYIRIDFDYDDPFADPLNKDGRPPATARYSSGIAMEQLDPAGSMNK